MSIKIYLEGGGRGTDRTRRKGGRSEQTSRFREGFIKFIKKAKLTGSMPRFLPCGSRERAFNDFKKAVANGGAALLLVDAEQPVNTRGPWQHLKASDNWSRPGSVTDNECHLMVQAMESWFLADVDALSSFFGQDFQESALPQNPRIEEVPKQDVERGVRQATRNTSKGAYAKGRHSFEILAELDPGKVRQRSTYANRFLSELERRSQE